MRCHMCGSKVGLDDSMLYSFRRSVRDSKGYSRPMSEYRSIRMCDRCSDAVYARIVSLKGKAAGR